MFHVCNQFNEMKLALLHHTPNSISPALFSSSIIRAYSNSPGSSHHHALPVRARNPRRSHWPIGPLAVLLGLAPPAVT